MKIAWFTPFHDKSAIGQVSKDICEALLTTDEVDIFTPDFENNIKTHVPVKYFSSPNNLQNLDRYDHVIYNMGNYLRNHGKIWEVMQMFPGIALLHDQIMLNFFVETAFIPQTEKSENIFLELLRKFYGPKGEFAGRKRFNSFYGEDKARLWESDALSAFPLYEPILQKTTAVFTHAGFFAEIIRDNFYGPIGYAYLPQSLPEIPIELKTQHDFSENNKALVVSNGIVHPLKRIDRVTEMLLANPDIAKRVHYVIIGGYGGNYGDDLIALAKGPLKGCLELLGYQSDEIMQKYLNDADFCINLRFPNSEVGSKSLFEQMSYGNPVIVLNSGIFGEIPDNCVVKININNELLDLKNAFIRLLENHTERKSIGIHASDFIKNNCSAEIYVEKLKSFLQSISSTNTSKNLLEKCISLNQLAFSDLSFDQLNAPWLIEMVSKQLNSLFDSKDSTNNDTKVIGLWLAFPYSIGLKREGITKFLLYLLLALLEYYPVECEIWTYSINENEIRESFNDVINSTKYTNKVRIVTEKNFPNVLNVPFSEKNIPWDINERVDNLSYVARKYSKASLFVPAIVYLDNVIETGKPLFVPVHDLGIYAHYNDFVEKDPLEKARFVDIRSRVENFARSGAFMFSNSEFVRNEHLLKYIVGVSETQTKVIYLPTNIPKDILSNLLTKNEIRKKFKFDKPYIFYPTQVRPYKNLALLIEAFSKINRNHKDMHLVLTGSPSDVPQVKQLIDLLNLNDRIICISDVSEQELYSLYKYADLTAVPTLFEGGFPWQACEALFMDTPLVLSNIPVVMERIESCGFTLENCGLTLFDPHNATDLVNAIEKVLQNREASIERQTKFKEKFLAYSWKEASSQYYDLFFNNKE